MRITTASQTVFSNFFFAGFGQKICLQDGSWFKHPDSNKTWSNYTTCVDLDDLKVGVYVCVCVFFLFFPRPLVFADCTRILSTRTKRSYAQVSVAYFWLFVKDKLDISFFKNVSLNIKAILFRQRQSCHTHWFLRCII